MYVGWILKQPSQYKKVIRSYKTSMYVLSGDFSAKLCNTWVKQYNLNFDRITAECWEEILEYYDIVCDSDIERVGNQSILDKGQADLLMSSSLSTTTDY
jgi:hypothetical protein